MASAKSFEELDVWKSGRKLVADIYRVTTQGALVEPVTFTL